MKKILLFLLFTWSAFANIGNIMALKGQAQILRQHLIPATNGMKILQGDQVITRNRTRVQIILKDETMITIGANSSFKFDKYLFDGTKNSMVKMKANHGFFRSVTGKIGKLAPERFTVETSSATIGIRGTDFSAKIQNAIERFKCYSGSITITTDDLVKILNAGEFFELVPEKVRIAPKTMDKVQAEQKVPKTEEVSDISELDQSEHITKPIEPTPYIPEGIPCEPCPTQSYK